MEPRTFTFLIAGVITIATGIALYRSRGRDRDSFEVATGPHGWSITQLLLASFLTLFAELAFIRWIAVEVRVFAYFKNLALLLCFVGFGLGCALARQSTRWLAGIAAFLGLVVMVRLPIENGRWLEGLSQMLGAAGDVEIWATGTSWHWARFLLGALVAV